MEKITKKEFSNIFENKTACALIGAPCGWTLEKLESCLNNFTAESIKYNSSGKILGGRHAQKITQKNIVFVLHDTQETSNLQLTNGDFYVHECSAGKFAIAFFDNGKDFRSNAIVYAISKTGL